MISNLSNEAKEAIRLAKAEATNLQHYYIGVEHLFLGLCQITDTSLNDAMAKFKLDSIGVNQVRSFLAPEEGEPIWGHEFIYTPRTQKVLQLAEKICKQMRNPLVSPSHIMLAILLEGRSIPARVFRELWIDFTQLQLLFKDVAKLQAQNADMELINRNTPYLNDYGRDLTFLARRGKLDPTIGREREIQELAYILKKKTKNNPLILGEAGVGKTQLVEGIAQEIVSPHFEVAKSLKDKRIIEIELNSLVAGTAYRGEFEARLERVIKEAMDNNIILFIDEFHTLMDAGSAVGAHGAAQIMKPYLSRGEIQCIGATTLEDYNKFVEGDKALARRFEIIQLNEPNLSETLDILKGLKNSYETYHRVSIEEDALKAAVEYAARYIPDRYFPDKAIALLDTACAQHSLGEGERLTIKRTDIAKVIFQRTGIRVQFEQDDKEALMHLGERLAERVIGQEEAITAVVNTVRNARMGLLHPRRPDGVFLLGGPTGVGKTELVRALAEILFGNEDSIIRLDMSEYMESHTVSRMVGAPPGYVGYTEGGALTESVRRRPYSIVLLDEIEKAHQDVFNILLQVFDDGRLTDGRGRTADFSNTVIFMTSNLGAAQMKIKGGIGFGRNQLPSPEKSYEILKRNFLTEVEKFFSLEFRNRIDAIIVFKPLTEPVVRRIIDKFLRQIHDRPGLRERNITLQLDDSVYEMLMEHGYSYELGAREMERTIQKLIIDPLGQELAQHDIPQNSTLYVRIKDDQIDFCHKT